MEMTRSTIPADHDHRRLSKSKAMAATPPRNGDGHALEHRVMNEIQVPNEASEIDLFLKSHTSPPKRQA
jgi:hypothetical protein